MKCPKCDHEFADAEQPKQFEKTTNPKSPISSDLEMRIVNALALFKADIREVELDVLQKAIKYKYITDPQKNWIEKIVARFPTSTKGPPPPAITDAKLDESF